MDENPKSPPVYLAPAAAGGASAWRLPGRHEVLGVDDHVVEPEVTRDELVRGVRMIASPAQAPHGDLHQRLSEVLGAHLRAGYVGSTDLLTRWNKGSDFASDSSIRRAGTDPSTGQRFLEEVTFEIVSTQSLADVTRRAEDMAARGVRRIFAIFVKKRRVSEWSARLGAFQPLDPEGEIRDETLSCPLPVKALFDPAAARVAIVRALEASRDPEIEAIKARTKAEDLLTLLASRGLVVSKKLRDHILGCRDLSTLEGWLRRALVVITAEELLG